MVLLLIWFLYNKGRIKGDVELTETKMEYIII